MFLMILSPEKKGKILKFFKLQMSFANNVLRMKRLNSQPSCHGKGRPIAIVVGWRMQHFFQLKNICFKVHLDLCHLLENWHINHCCSLDLKCSIMYTKNARNNCPSNVGLMLCDYIIMRKQTCKYCVGPCIKVTKDIYIPRDIRRYYVTCTFFLVQVQVIQNCYKLKKPCWIPHERLLP